MAQKVAMIINSPSYDRVAFALSVATMSAVHLKEVHVLFTYGAVRRLLRDQVDRIGEETEIWIRKDVKRGLKEGTIPKISEMMHHLKEFGGKIYACVASLAFHKISKDDLIEEAAEVISISGFLEKTEDAKTLYV